MLSLSAQQVKDLAVQALLGVTEEEIGVLSPAINQTLQSIEEIRKAPVSEGEPTVNEGGERLRADQVCLSWPQEAVLSNAPKQFDACFQTPLVLEE